MAGTGDRHDQSVMHRQCEQTTDTSQVLHCSRQRLRLDLRLVRLGYTKIDWYRGGRETLGGKGIARSRGDVQEW